MRIVSVILNYNDAARSCAQAQRLRKYALLDYVLVVDNASTDGSAEQLAALQDEKVILLRADENRGYGAGNNMGVNYARMELGASHVVIANPDTCFDEECIRAMAEVFRRNPEAGAVSVMMHDSQNGLQQTAWPLRPWSLELANSGPLLRRLLRSRINYSSTCFTGHKAVQVDVLHGSMLMVDTEAFHQAGGYDEAVFLYSEENILGFRLKKAGYRSYLLPNRSYEHENSGSISRTYRSMLPKQKLRQASEFYYYVHYLKIGPIRQLLTRLFHSLVLLETWTAEKLRLL